MTKTQPSWRIFKLIHPYKGRITNGEIYWTIIDANVQESLDLFNALASQGFTQWNNIDELNKKMAALQNPKHD